MSRNQKLRLFHAARFFKQALRETDADNEKLLAEIGSLRYELESAYRTLAVEMGQPLQPVGASR